MDLHKIETQRAELLNSLPRLSGKTKLFKISSFYSILLSSEDKNIIDAYSLDFIQEFLSELKLFVPFYQAPEKSYSLVIQLNELKTIPTLLQFENGIDEIIETIEARLKELNNILNGEYSKIPIRTLSFPLLETLQDDSHQDSFGTLESVCIKISKAKGENRFVFVPSDKKIEERLLNQTKISFQLALNYFQRHQRKFHRYHEVLIYFENLSALYEGNSLGVALTIGFIEQLSILYNLPYITNIKNNIATTGGVEEKGNIQTVSNEIIKKKIDIVFYSDVQSFIVPKEDEEFARQRKKQLKELYPKRQLTLSAIENINELLNRRDLVDIKKQSTVVRTIKSIKRNRAASILFFLLIIFLSLSYIFNYDDNPFTYELTQNQIVIKNKYESRLWGLDFLGGGEFMKKMKWAPTLEAWFRILDVNGDGKNEVLFCYTSGSKYSNATYSNGLVLLDYKGKILWRRSFKKDLFSKREHLTSPYYINIFDTLRINNEPCIFCSSNNVNSYASAAYILDLRNNKVISDTLWSPGFINDIKVIKAISDDNKEILVLSNNNSFQKNCLLRLRLNEFKGQLPVTDDYKFHNVKMTNVLSCFLFPNSDYNSYLKQRMTGSSYRGLIISKETKTIRFSSHQDSYEMLGAIFYNWHYDTNEFEISIGNDFRVMRDSLVAHGILPPPYTDTKEYRELLRSQIQAWDGKKFISIDEYKKKSAITQ